MKRVSVLLQTFFLFGIAVLIAGCGGSSSATPPVDNTVALVSVQADSSSPTMPPAHIVATFNAKVISLAPGFFTISGTCATLPTATTAIDASGKVVTVTLAGGNCTGQTLTLTLDPDGASFDTAIAQKGAVWTRSYTIPNGAQSVGGAVTGLAGTLVLQNNGGDAQTLRSDGHFTFPTLVPDGSPYAVTVQTQPAGQTCTVSNGSGTMTAAAVQNVTVVCSTNVQTVGGMVTGLLGTVVLQDNGGDNLTLSADGAFTFPVSIAEGSPYAVTVLTQPATQTCTVSNGSGTVGASAIQNVMVSCSTNAYTVGGTVTGLTGTVTLQDNGGDDLALSNDGSFTFPTPVATGAPYNVTVQTQPAAQTCTVSNGTGTLGSANVTNVQVLCVTETAMLSVSPTGTIPVGAGAGSLTVTNIGPVAALNVHAVLPSGWATVTQDASNCTSIAPGDTCILSFFSQTAFVAQANIQIVGDNVGAPPTTALAFTVDSYLVWEVIDSSTAYVMDSNDISASVQWGPSGSTTNATSPTDGEENTQMLVGISGFETSAAASCYNSTAGGAAVGTWYLPAICELGSGGDCLSNLPNIDTNLVQLGFGGLAPNFYWSSTEIPNAPDAYVEGFNGSPGHQFVGEEETTQHARCVRRISYPQL